MTDPIYGQFERGFERALGAGEEHVHRIGAELKFPLVNPDGSAAPESAVQALWDYLVQRGWRQLRDATTGGAVGAAKRGEHNDTVASCETGYCKPEFSLAHVADLHQLDRSIAELRTEIRSFSEQNNVLFIGYGIHPVTPPSKHLLMKKGRTSVWNKVFASNQHVPEKDGDDLHLFTINTASHVHVSVPMDEAVRAVNVLNGFAGAQIALTANSSIWRGAIDERYKCVAEKFWDWWMPDGERVGIPEEPFQDLHHYVQTVAGLRPVFVKRAGRPIVLQKYATFEEYFHNKRAVGIDDQGREISFAPEKGDIDLHSSCYWFNARISQYYTVENRANDQQPPDALLAIAALTTGLISALPEAEEELASYEWHHLRQAREAACQSALGGTVDSIRLTDLAGRMLDLADLGLRRRARGEKGYLQPLRDRVQSGRCPADEAADLFERGGIPALLSNRRL